MGHNIVLYMEQSCVLTLHLVNTILPMLIFGVLIIVLWIYDINIGEAGWMLYGNSVLFLQLFYKSRVISK